MERTRLHALESSSSLHPSSVRAPWAEIIAWSKWCGPRPRSVTPVARRHFSRSRTAAAKALNTSRPSGVPRHRRMPMSRLDPRITSGTRSSPMTVQAPAGNLYGLKVIASRPGIRTEKPPPRGANLPHSGDGLFHERPASRDTRPLLVWNWRLRGRAFPSSTPPLFQPIGLFAQVGRTDTPVWISVLNRPLISQRRFHVPFEHAGGTTDHAI